MGAGRCGQRAGSWKRSKRLVVGNVQRPLEASHVKRLLAAVSPACAGDMQACFIALRRPLWPPKGAGQKALVKRCWSKGAGASKDPAAWWACSQKVKNGGHRGARFDHAARTTNERPAARSGPAESSRRAGGHRLFASRNRVVKQPLESPPRVRAAASLSASTQSSIKATESGRGGPSGSGSGRWGPSGRGSGMGGATELVRWCGRA